MSATVIPMRPPVVKPGQSLCAHPDGVTLVPEPELVGAAAYAIATLAGEDWNRMTPSKLQEYREWATLAAMCGKDAGQLRLVGYAMAREDDEFPNWQPQHRRTVVERLMRGLRAAALRMAGVANPGTQRALVALIEQDAAADKVANPKRAW